MIVMMFGYGNSWPAWEIALMWIGMIAFLGVLTWAAYALISSAARRPRQDRPDEADHRDQPRGTDARRILDERLARGQIDDAEYQRLRDLIAAGGDHAPAAAGTQ